MLGVVWFKIRIIMLKAKGPATHIESPNAFQRSFLSGPPGYSHQEFRKSRSGHNGIVLSDGNLAVDLSTC